MWAVHPRLLHWIGEPLRPLLASPIIVWAFGRHSVLQTPLYSTDNTTSHNSVALRQIWTNDTYSGLVNKQGYSRGSKIFKAMDDIKTKENEMVAKAIAKKIVHRIDDPNV